MFGIAIVLLGYGGLCGLVWRYQNSLIFFPSADIRGTPTQPYKEVELITEDGVHISAWKIPPVKEGKLWVLFCHGNGGNVSDRLGIISLLHDMGVGVMVFDYRSYGHSSGEIRTERDLVTDAQACLLDLERTVPADHIVLYGESLGGGVACQLALTQKFAGLILQSTFTSLTARATDSYPFLPVSLLCRYRFDNLDAVSKIDCPKLIMHSPGDEVTDYKHGRKLLEAAKAPTEWGELKGSHNDPDPVSLATPLQKFLAGLSPHP